MNNNNFQEGVGKKIVEALKKKDDTTENVNLADYIDTSNDVNFSDMSSIMQQANDVNYNNPSFEQASPIQHNFNQNYDNMVAGFSSKIEEPSFNYQQSVAYNDAQFSSTINKISQQSALPTGQHMPPNVAVLRKLIAQLPNGVTKQTGAQIIRQTMEALGISMNNVLHEAQQVQDGLNESVKTCMYSVQEYKNNIKTLEKQVLDYQKQIAHLNDLISLFVMTDKTR